jgi:hypothetical protein
LVRAAWFHQSSHEYTDSNPNPHIYRNTYDYSYRNIHNDLYLYDDFDTHTVTDHHTYDNLLGLVRLAMDSTD